MPQHVVVADYDDKWKDRYAAESAHEFKRAYNGYCAKERVETYRPVVVRHKRFKHDECGEQGEIAYCRKRARPHVLLWRFGPGRIRLPQIGMFLHERS